VEDVAVAQSLESEVVATVQELEQQAVQHKKPKEKLGQV
jgi:hypothetical protein